MKAVTNLEEEKIRLEMELKRINDQMEDACRMGIPRMITIREAARETGLSYKHIRSLCQSGRIVSIRAGNRNCYLRRSFHTPHSAQVLRLVVQIDQ